MARVMCRSDRKIFESCLISSRSRRHGGLLLVQDVIARWYMVVAFGRLARNGFCWIGVELVVRKFCMMGPQRPNGSSTKASRIVLAVCQ